MDGRWTVGMSIYLEFRLSSDLVNLKVQAIRAIA
jgi:hypothetical protein